MPTFPFRPSHTRAYNTHTAEAVTAIAPSLRYDDAVAIDSVAYNFAADQLA